MGLAVRILLTGWMCLLGLSPAAALDPARSIAQYKHTIWTVDNGVPPVLVAMDQDRAGYLWLGGQRGLYRFDGISFESMLPERPRPSTAVSGVVGARDGSVWVGFSRGPLARYSNGVLRDVRMPGGGGYVVGMLEASDGAIWIRLGRQDESVLRFWQGRWTTFGEAQGIPRGWITSMIATRDGRIWLTLDKSLLVLPKGGARFQPVSAAPSGNAALSQDPAGRVWLSDEKGSRPVTDSGAEVTYPTLVPKLGTYAFFDRDGNLWGKSPAGVYRVAAASRAAQTDARSTAAAVENFGTKQGATSDSINAIMEDREGNIWLATNVGLERLRATSVAIEPQLTDRALYGDKVLAASDGIVYVGEADAVYRVLPGGRPQILMRHGENTEAICEGPDRTIWIVTHERIVKYRGGHFTVMERPKVTESWVADCAVDRSNRIWLAASGAGLYRQLPSGWQRLMIPARPGMGAVRSILAERNGTLLSVVEPNRVKVLDPSVRRDVTFTPPDPSHSAIKTLYPTPAGILLGGRFGLARWLGDRAQLVSADRAPALRSVSGIVQTPEGDTWTIGVAGIARTSTSELDKAFADPHRPLRTTSFDVRDGFPGSFNPEGVRDAVRGGDGRLWFATYEGTVMVDPARLPRNTLPPPVAISALKTQARLYRDPGSIRLPEGTSDVEIDFVALSLSIPERVQVRYRLDGVDKGWVDPGMRRQAFYTNLPPGKHVFRVVAANNDGVWNRTGAALSIEIPPTFLQSKWFIALCIVALGALLWCSYQLRIRQLRRKLRDTLEQRLAERERIARDLHDTLLQGFQGLILQFQSVANAIPSDQRAHHLIEQALGNADEVLNDGRASVLQLRAARVGDLAQGFSELAERLRRDFPAQFDLVVEGTARALHPVVQDEASRIGDEALINAFRHAKAERIEMVISYTATVFSLGIRDDGSGIAKEFIELGGRQGHFGLTGMRERAAQIDADLSISSLPGSGTEITLTVPGRVAFARARADLSSAGFKPDKRRS